MPVRRRSPVGRRRLAKGSSGSMASALRPARSALPTPSANAESSASSYSSIGLRRRPPHPQRHVAQGLEPVAGRRRPPIAQRGLVHGRQPAADGAARGADVQDHLAGQPERPDAGGQRLRRRVRAIEAQLRDALQPLADAGHLDAAPWPAGRPARRRRPPCRGPGRDVPRAAGRRPASPTSRRSVAAVSGAASVVGMCGGWYAGRGRAIVRVAWCRRGRAGLRSGGPSRSSLAMAIVPAVSLTLGPALSAQRLTGPLPPATPRATLEHREPDTIHVPAPDPTIPAVVVDPPPAARARRTERDADRAHRDEDPPRPDPGQVRHARHLGHGHLPGRHDVDGRERHGRHPRQGRRSPRTRPSPWPA